MLGAMRKTRLYLDTSPIIRVSDDRSPIRQAITKEFFRMIAERSEEYELFISPVTFEELDDGTEDRKAASDLVLAAIDYTKLPLNDDAEDLAELYVREGVLSQTHIDDLRHVAYATFFRCDYVITWNMRHLANEQTLRRVSVVNTVENYGKLYIATPEFFIGGKIYGK
jgi:hypothetical protein